MTENNNPELERISQLIEQLCPGEQQKELAYKLVEEIYNLVEKRGKRALPVLEHYLSLIEKNDSQQLLDEIKKAVK